VTKFEEYRIKKKLDEVLLDLEDIPKTAPLARRKPFRLSARPSPRRQTQVIITKVSHRSDTEALLVIGAIDILLFGFSAIFFILPFIVPDYEIGFVFGIALLLSFLTRSILARLTTLIFTVVYFILIMMGEMYFGIGDIVNFALGNNQISYVPYYIGTLLVILAMGAGIAYGLSPTTRLAGLWVVFLAFIIATADTLVGFFLLGLQQWELIFTSRFTIYLVAILIAWGIFYVSSKSIRWGITTALR